MTSSFTGAGFTNWQQEALSFLHHLYPIKQDKDLGRMRRSATDLVQRHAHALTAALVLLEDDITARIYYAAGQAVSGFIHAPQVSAVINKAEIAVAGSDTFAFPVGERYVLLPVRIGAFSGMMVLAYAADFVMDEGFHEFLNYTWTGLKDIVALVQTYYAHEQLTTRFNTIMGTVEEGMVFVDDGGREGWVNIAAARLLHLQHSRNNSMVLSGAMRNLRMTATNQDEIEAGGLRLFNHPNQTIKDWRWVFGNPVSRVLNVSCVPAVSDNVNGRLWVFSDITPLYLANLELADQRKLADEQNIAKSDFLANMSHEIRTPMNGVIGMTSLLANTPLNEEQRDYLETIRVSGESLLSIINDILDFSKIESGKMELESYPFRLSTVIEETYDLLSVKANEKGLDLLYYIEPNVPGEILGDVTRFRQVLVNLVSNGLKFTEKGEILITVETAGVNDGDYTLRVTVKDTGIGIPADKQHRLFQSFSQVDSSTTRKYGGTGLGLAICQKLVSLMEGQITVESEPGKGSSFIFTFHTRANTQAVHYNARKKEQTVQLAGKSILILDDNATNLKILSRQCEWWGMRITAVDNYEDALSRLQQVTYDVAMIDMMMPGKDGIEVGGIIRQAHPNMPLILFSSAGYLPEGVPIHTIFNMVLNKPIKHNQIEEALLRVIGQEAPLQAMPAAATTLPAATDVLPLNILVAEDDVINQKLIRRALEKLGYTFDLVDNGRKAVEAVNQKAYHLVFMDVMMPEMDGYEAAHVITSAPPATARPVIIALTANALSGEKEKLMAAGMDDYLSKPYKVQDIGSMIEKWAPKLLNQP
jgi:signal transduction histidine kinase/DNA-binding response OmpR family regulator